MVAFFMVSIDQLEADADLRMVEERVREALQAKFPYHDVTVEQEHIE